MEGVCARWGVSGTRETSLLIGFAGDALNNSSSWDEERSPGSCCAHGSEDGHSQSEDCCDGVAFCWWLRSALNMVLMVGVASDYVALSFPLILQLKGLEAMRPFAKPLGYIRG